jgi:hypothetical protein
MYTIAGTVASPDRAGVGNLSVQIVDKVVGPDVLIATAATDAGGNYSVSVDISTDSLRERQKEAPDLQARVYVGSSFLAASDVRYNASPNETLNVFLPANATGLPSEYETLIAAIGANHRGRLGDLQEDADRSDITYLANKTGWDARAVALIALADQFSANSPPTAGARANGSANTPPTTAVRANGSANTPETPGAPASGIRPEFYYALFRSGLPANPDVLYRADLQTVRDVWNNATTQGVIPSSLATDIPAALTTFEQLSVRCILDVAPAKNVSSFRPLLQLTFGEDESKAQQFATLYVQHQHDLPTFWESVQRAFGEDTAGRLKLDGQLAFLTLNNAALMSRLHYVESTPPLRSLFDLVRRGYHQPAKWEALLPAQPVDGIPGNTDAERRANYVALITAQLRLSYPTAVLAEMVNDGTTQLTTDDNVRKAVYEFLTKHEGKYELGVLPLDQYLAENGLTGETDPTIATHIKRLQRVYQMTTATPGERAMNALLRRKVDSAYAIVQYGQPAFVRAFKDDMGEDVAQLTFAKAQLIHNAVLGVTTDYITRRVAPRLGNGVNTYIGPFPDNANPASTQNRAVSATLETLFGSMDYCACEECRSVLGPAAYLVDLLEFTDCKATPNNSANPQAVLFQRRPDLPSLLLTCANTNTALPYIDLVNETLEYFVAYGSLAGYQGYNTDDTITSAELLASPQNVNSPTPTAAYATLQSAHFPPPLPFHRPLELLRSLFQHFNVRLADAMAVLRSSDSSYDWRDILMEQVGMCREEYRILTDSNLSLQQLYGYPADTDVVAALSNVQDYSRRLGVSYDDLIAILQTRFVNPNSILLPQLERLQVPFTTLQQLKNGMDHKEFQNLLPQGPAAPNPADYGGDIADWIIEPARYARIMSLITIANPSNDADLSHLRLQYSNPDTAANALQPIDFVRLLRFIRLRRKLGLTIQQTDDLIGALSPSIARIVVGGFTANQELSGTLAGTTWKYTTSDAGTNEDIASGIATAIGAVAAGYSIFSTCAEVDIRGESASTFPIDDVSATAGGSVTLTIITDSADLQLLDEKFLALLPRVGFAFEVLSHLNLTPDRDLRSLLACWSSIGTFGADSLYAAMFLNPTLLQQDPAFAKDQTGNLLQDSTQRLLPHDLALRGAFGLTNAEFAAICAALGYDDTTKLTLAHISDVYRRGWLAHALGISVVELLLLIQYTGLDPFASPDPAPAPPVEPPTIRLIRLIQAMAAASLRPVQALYLIWNQDINGKSAPSDRDVTALAFALRSALATVDTQFAWKDDPTGAVAQSLVALVYGADAASFLFGLLNNTFSVSAPYAGIVPEDVIAASGVQPDPQQSPRLKYDSVALQLTFLGDLDSATMATMQTAANANDLLLRALTQLQSASQAAVNPFFARYPDDLQKVYKDYIASNDTPHNKRAALLADLLPDLQRQRKEQQALAVLTAASAIDSNFATTLLQDPAILHAADGANESGVIDLSAIQAQGFSVAFFLTNDATATPDTGVDNVPALSYAANSPNILPAGTGGSPIAGIWSGYLNAPQDGLYFFKISTDADSVTLRLGGSPITLARDAQEGDVWSTGPVLLTAGNLASFELTATTLTARLSLTWQTSGSGWDLIPAAYMYSRTIVDRLRTTYVRFLKATSLASSLSLNARELAFLAKYPDFNVTGWLNALIVSGSPDAASASALLPVLTGLLTFASLKAALSPKDERFLTVLQNPAMTLANGQDALLTLTGWEKESRDALLTHFFGASDVSLLSHLENFRRVFDAYAVVRACGVSGWALVFATTNDPDADDVAGFQCALRARYAEADWLSLIKPINDTMRRSQRDALVAYVLQLTALQSAVVDFDTPVNTPETLFEYLLMDPEMDPCMQTSRIRLAISSVQLFVERCLRSLELNPNDLTKNVDPACFSTSNGSVASWTWMKRYRLWQANREVFLWPENWLDPELRDDQSPFFQTIMKKLLQSDLTDEAASYAYLEYLSDLEQVAKLDPCDMCWVPAKTSRSASYTHVVARTAGANRSYYYRFHDGASWAPWQEIPLKIEDTPVGLVVWKDRLLLFWLQVTQVPNASGLDSLAKIDPAITVGQIPMGKLTAALGGTTPSLNVQVSVCWSEYYNSKWHAGKISDTAIDLGSWPSSGDGRFDRSLLAFWLDPSSPDAEPLNATPSEDTLRIGVSYQKTKFITFAMYNTHSEPIPQAQMFFVAWRSAFIVNYLDEPEGLVVSYSLARSTDDSYLDFQQLLKIKGKDIGARTVDPYAFPYYKTGDIAESLLFTQPFLFADAANSFCVRPQATPISAASLSNYGIRPLMPPVSVRVPPLVLKDGHSTGRTPTYGPAIAAQSAGTVDPSRIARIVAQTPYIMHEIDTPGRVLYRQTLIGPSGRLTN